MIAITRDSAKRGSFDCCVYTRLQLPDLDSQRATSSAATGFTDPWTSPPVDLFNRPAPNRRAVLNPDASGR